MAWKSASALQITALTSIVLFAGGTRVSLNTSLGTLTGTSDLVEFDGQYRPVHRFLGIPYAKPPLGERRFARPEPYGNLNSLYNATYHRPHCLQYVPPYYIHLQHYNKSEDCLYLNLYIPGNSTSLSAKYPVMVYIHGGSFALGGADIYSGDRLSAFNDVIVVTINYRLNVFGFLSNGTKSSGNYGLWDMRLAIQWVHDHVQEFGGDPSRVTVFGNSAGGAAVTYMAVYPPNRGLFQRGIAQSGSFMAYWAFQRNPTENFVEYVSKHDCNKADSESVMTCLRSKTEEELQVGSWSFLPSIDGDFLPEEPSKLLSGQSVAGVAALEILSEIDFIFGVTNKDGAYMVSSWEQALKKQNIDINSGVPRHYFEDSFIPATLPYMTGGSAPQQAIKSAIFQYTDWTKPDDPLVVRSKMIDFQSDVDFFIPATQVMQKHKEVAEQDQNPSSYFYVFAQKPSFVPVPIWLEGAVHTMDVPYIFGLVESLEGKLIDDQGAIDPFVTQPEDVALAKKVMQMFTNFAKTGNPNIDGNPVWPEYDSDQQLYLEISANMTTNSVKDHFASDRVAFWTRLLPAFSDCGNSNISSAAVQTHPRQPITYLLISVLFLNYILRF